MLLKNAKEADCNNSGVLSPCRGLIVITSSQKKKNYMGIYININNIIFLAYVLSLLYSYVIFGVID